MHPPRHRTALRARRFVRRGACPDAHPRWFSLDPLDNDPAQMRQQNPDNIIYVVIAPAKQSMTPTCRSRTTRRRPASITT
jgi:hypothetical protein